MNIKSKLSTIAVLAALVGCSVTNTGNPAQETPDNSETPRGIELVRSSLERESKPSVSADDRDRFASDSRDFALDLYGQVSGNKGNVFISPYSVRIALAMVYAGAEGKTKSEMADALKFTLADSTLHRAFNATDLALAERPNEVEPTEKGDKNTGEVKLHLVNGAFLQKGMEFKKPFLDTLASNYGAGLFAADFKGNAERERLAINDWVEAQTATRIKDLLDPKAVSALTRFVLVNTVYFKGSWANPFMTEYTKDAAFHAPSGDVTVRMMSGGAEKYAEGDGYVAVELSYVAPALRMLIVLPDEGRFEEIEKGFDREFFDGVRAALGNQSVSLALPKFTFEFGVKLNDAMKALGIEQAFVLGDADFSGITGDKSLYVDGIIHKTFVAVDERGTEAAAATAVVGAAGSVPKPVTCDRPFLFVIYDEPTGQILFLGRLTDPTPSK
jgi:serpin B